MMTRISSQSGNALFLILIAVILFAALTYALTQSNRGGAAPQKEQIEIKIAQISNQMALSQNSYMRLKLKGCNDEDIDGFSGDPPFKAECAFFAKNGGNFPFASEDQPQQFILLKMSLPGIGTSKDDVVTELIHHDGSMNDKICNAFNQKNGVIRPIDHSDSFYETGLVALNGTDKNDPSFLPIEYKGARQACVFNANNDTYVIYQAIEER